jgi:hypothetical protein
MMAMVKAMPDWKFNAQDYQENGDQVTMKLGITGTQTGELQLPIFSSRKQSCAGVTAG